jgi:hypothetical protein
MDIGSSSALVMNTLTNFVSDFLVILVILGIFSGYIFWKGRSGVVALTLSLFIALLLFLQLPIDVPTLGNPLQDFFAKAAVFFATALIIHYFMLSFIAIEGWPYGMMRFISPAFLVLGGTLLVLGVLFQVLGLGEVYVASPYISMLFAPPEQFFWWLVGPLIALLVFSRA